MTPVCVFCAIAAGTSPAAVVREWDDAVAFMPLEPVVQGHTLVIPKVHVADFVQDPDVTGLTAKRAAGLARDRGMLSANLITSMGEDATQSVYHLHFHLIPRAAHDGFALPWDPRRGGTTRTTVVTGNTGQIHTGRGDQITNYPQR
jgi:histidine triad (HIT) family protein